MATGDSTPLCPRHEIWLNEEGTCDVCWLEAGPDEDEAYDRHVDACLAEGLSYRLDGAA